MSALQALAIFAAGLLAGTINTVVGSGTLISFPVLLAFGYPAVTANVSNTVGLVPGAVSAAVGYRRELAGQVRRVAVLASCTIAGAIVGAILLLSLPGSAFTDIVPAFIALALVLIVFQRQINRLLEGRGGGRSAMPGPLARVGVGAGGVYGGYFGAAQGILVLSILGLSIDDRLQRLNAAKVVTVGLTNVVSGIIFVVAGRVDWAPAGLIAAGSVLGGVLGARLARRLPPAMMRAVIVVVGVVAIVRLLA